MCIILVVVVVVVVFSFLSELGLCNVLGQSCKLEPTSCTVRLAELSLNI